MQIGHRSQCELKGCNRAIHRKRYFLHIETIPQELFSNGQSLGMETSPAGRSIVVCSRHIGQATQNLYKLPNIAYGSVVQIRIIES